MENRKLRVVIIENNEMGIKSYNYDLVRAVSEKYETTILTEIEGVFEITGFRKDVQFINVGKSVMNPFAALLYMFKLYRGMKKVKPDVCLTFTIRPNIYGNIVSRILHIPTITSVTGIGPLFENKGLAYTMARWLYKRVLKKTRLVAFPNNDDLALFIEKKFVRPEQTQIVAGSGVNVEYFSPRPADQKHKDKFIFLFIGRLLRDKGVLEFVEAAGMVKNEHENVEFQIIGPVWNSNKRALAISATDVETWEKAGIITYLGTKNDVRPYIANSDCVVMPSYREGMNNVLLEAASMERPLITTNVTGCKEIVDEGVNGLLCAVRDSRDLAAKMIQMIHFSPWEREKMGKAGREKITKEFDKKIVVKDYLNAIEKIILEGKAGEKLL